MFLLPESVLHRVKKPPAHLKRSHMSVQPWEVRLSCAAPCQLRLPQGSPQTTPGVNPRQFIITSEVHPLRSMIFSSPSGQTPPSSLLTSAPSLPADHTAFGIPTDPPRMGALPFLHLPTSYSTLGWAQSLHAAETTPFSVTNTFVCCKAVFQKPKGSFYKNWEQTDMTFYAIIKSRRLSSFYFHWEEALFFFPFFFFHEPRAWGADEQALWGTLTFSLF